MICKCPMCDIGFIKGDGSGGNVPFPCYACFKWFGVDFWDSASQEDVLYWRDKKEETRGGFKHADELMKTGNNLLYWDGPQENWAHYLDYDWHGPVKR